MGAGFPAFLVGAAIAYEALLMAILLLPDEIPVWGSFSNNFKTWCFQFDPETGAMEWMAVLAMLIEPLFIAGLTALLWQFNPFRLQSWQGVRRPAVTGILFTVFALAGLAGHAAIGNSTGKSAAPPPFPAERIRLNLPGPSFSLTDQRGNTLQSDTLRGRVVLITGVYAICSTSCPQILLKIKNLLEDLPPETRETLTVLALSLNPEYDTPELMDRIARSYEFSYPRFRYLNGAPEVMEPLLDHFQFARQMDPDTGIVNHANLIILLDTKGRIAYRFGIEKHHPLWLRKAIETLSGNLPVIKEPFVARSH